MTSLMAWSCTLHFILLLLLPSLSALPSHARTFSTLSSTLSPSPSSEVVRASASACLNDCSGHGSCSPAATCLCDEGYLGIDCHLPSLMQPLCVPPSSAFLFSTSLSASSSAASPLCLYWRIAGSVYYQRVVAVNNPNPADPTNATNVGWAGVLWDNDPDQGSMAGGKLVLLTVPSPYSPRVQDLYAASDDTPALTADQTISAYNVTGHSTATTLDVSFQRQLNTSKAQHFAFSPQPGTLTNLGVAWLNKPLAFHDTNAHTFDPVDIAAMSMESACVADCSGNGECVGGACRCAVGYLGSSCAVKAAMAPLCFNGGLYCAYWAIVDSSLYVRVSAVTNPKASSSSPAAGYSAIMWGAASDGMTNGTGHRLYWSGNATAGRAMVTDIYATRQGRPSDATLQTASDVSGWATNTTLDIAFQRPLLAVDAQHFTLAAVPGVRVPLSVALGDSNFAHHTWAQQVSVDMAETAAGGVQCVNDCGQRGSCSALGFCQCNAGYLGADCSVTSLMAPLCFKDDAYCVYWRLQDAQLHLRVVAVTNPNSSLSTPAAGYAAIMWGAAADGMTNGSGHRMSWSGNYTVGRPLVTDIYATRRGPPSIAAVQTVSNVTGFATNSTIDVSFTRPLLAVDAQHFSISANDGYVVPLSVAKNEVSFSHHSWAQLTGVDMALTAAGGRCVNDCSGHGSCTSAVSCQCDAGYLGEDCSLLSIMQPLCYQSNANTTLCLYWRFASSTLYMRFVAQTSPNGWAAVMWGAGTDGMSGGLGHRVTVTANGIPQVVDIAAAAPRTPSVAAAQVATGIAGYSSAQLIDVSFQRPLIGLDAQHYNLSEVTGVLTPLSVAVGSATFSRHFFANRSLIDMAVAAQGSGCVGGCSGHGQCQAATSTCICEQHFLAADCSLPAANTQCPVDGFCMDWTVVQSTLFMRVRAAVSATGWAGIMWGADSRDGMTGGKGLVLSLSQAQASATEILSGGQATPASQAWDYIGRNVSGYSADGYVDVSFTRPCVVPQQPTALQLPTAADDSVLLSWAMNGNAWPAPHSASSSGKLQVDMVTGSATVVERPSLLSLYLPILVGAALIIAAAMFFRIPALAMSALGRCCLRKRVSSLSADAYALTAAHQREKSPLTSDSTDSALIVQSDESVTLTTRMKALLSVFDSLTLNAVTSVYHLTVGELLVLAVYFASMASFALAAVSSLPWAVVLGHLTAVHLTLTVLPVSRSSVWHAVFGISFERAIKWHRFVARATGALVLLHALLIIRANGLSILFSTTPLRNGMAAVYGSLAAACIFLMAATAISLIRRGLFELFYYVHLPLFASTMVFASLHSAYARYYLIAPLLAIAVDWAIRLARRCRAVQVVDATCLVNEEEGLWRVAKLTLRARMIPEPGQYVFLNVPSLSLLQWHPFSISSLPEPTADRSESTFTLHLLDMGKGTYTSDVCDALAASELAGGSSLSVSLDGPYGSLTIPYTLYPTLLMVAGGIGITPLASMLYSLLASSLDTRVFLIWSARHAASFHLLFPDLISRMQRDARMSVELFDTAGRASARAALTIGVGTEELLRNDSMSEEKEGTAGGLVVGWTVGDGVTGGVEVRKGRPCLPRVFEMVAGEHQEREAKKGPKRLHPSMQGAAGVGVLCCGPSALLDEVERESMRFGFHLHKETFLL